MEALTRQRSQMQPLGVAGRMGDTAVGPSGPPPEKGSAVWGAFVFTSCSLRLPEAGPEPEGATGMPLTPAGTPALPTAGAVAGGLTDSAEGA